MKISKIIKTINLKKIKNFFRKNILRFLNLFKKIKLGKLNEFINIIKKRHRWVFIVVILILIFLIGSNLYNNKECDDLEVENVEEEDMLSDEEIKEMEIEIKSEEETVYGILGGFWIEIDTEDLKIKAPIVEGVSKEKLDQGVGHHVTTAFPNPEKGNVVLSGHRWIAGDAPARTVFIDLDKLNIDDEVKLYYESKEFVYKITGSKVVKDTEVSILEQTDKPTITIYTCTPKYPITTPDKRLVYFGELVK